MSDWVEQAIDNWGVEAQKNQVIEECAELIQAINKHRRGMGSIHDIMEERVDVEIMLDQLDAMYPFTDIDIIKQEKIERLKRRLDMDVT